MTLPEESIWEEGVYQLEPTDLVLGGAVDEGGISNLQGLQLANRTRYLYDHLGTIGAYYTFDVSADLTLSSDTLRNSVVVLRPMTNGKIVFLNLDDLPVGAIITIMIKAETEYYGMPIGIKPIDGVVFSKTGFFDPVWLHTGESIQLLKSDDGMRILAHDSWIYDVGEIEFKWKAPVLSLPADGRIVNRNAYPRLWQWVQMSIPGGAGGAGAVISDSEWLASSNNRGMFSAGNGSTTFRLPDLRGMTLRANDNGASIDPGRIVGSYQSDAFKQHAHITGAYIVTLPMPTSGIIGAKAEGIPAVNATAGNPNATAGGLLTQNAGGTETRSKNISYTAYIKF